MSIKTLIVIILIALGGYMVYNMINKPEGVSVSQTNTASAKAATDTKISDKPLGQQPKAIMDKAVGDFEQAQKLEQDKIDEIESLQ